MHRRLLAALCLLSLAAPAHPARAASQLLPYGTRTKSYSGWSTTVHGDIRTIGMSGAVVGLANTFIASGDNPAGLAMTLENGGIVVTQNRIHDENIQDYDQAMTTTNTGATLNQYPWGFSLGYWVPNSEEQRYQFGAGGPEGNTAVFDREYRFSAARLFMKDKLSIGASMIYGQGVKSIDMDNPALSSTHHSHALGANVGAMVQLPRRFLLGLTYTFPMTYHSDALGSTSQGVANFHQPILSPFRVGAGVGWIPNRFFQAGFTVLFIGATTGVALLSDDTRLVGNNLTIQPRFGASYRAIELAELEVNLFAGTYLEISRLQNTGSRLHATAGLEINPWIFNFGWGIDESSRYQNFIYSAGIDVGRTLQKLELIPKGYRPPHGGVLPRPTHLGDDGLPRAINPHWVDHHEKNALQVGRELPKRIGDKVVKTGAAIGEGVGDGVEAIGDGVEAIGEGMIKTGGSFFDAFKSIPGRLKKEIKKTKQRQEKEERQRELEEKKKPKEE